LVGRRRCGRPTLSAVGDASAAQITLQRVLSLVSAARIGSEILTADGACCQAWVNLGRRSEVDVTVGRDEPAAWNS